MKHAERRPLKELDIIGCVLLVAASVLVVFAFQEGGLQNSQNSWATAIFLASLLVGCLCWALLLIWEAYGSRLLAVAPLLPIRLLKRRVFTAAVFCTITTGFVYFVVIYTLPLHFQVVYEKSALTAGVALLPMLGSAAIGSALAGALNAKKNNVFPTLVTASCFMAIGAGLLSTLKSLEVEAKVYGFQVFVGLGFGLTVSSVTMLAILESELADVGQYNCRQQNLVRMLT